MREVPIVANGQLAADAGAVLIGTMLYPHDPRSARQFATLLWEETVAQAAAKREGLIYSEGELFRAALTRHNFPLLAMVGNMALRIARDHIDGHGASKSVAAHVESERFSTAKRADGRPVPSDEKRLRATFNAVAPVVHLWGASEIVVNDSDGTRWDGVGLLSAILVSRPHLSSFLASAFMLEDVLKEAIMGWQPVSVPLAALNGLDLDQFRIRLNAEDPRVPDARSTYRSRSGS